MVEQLPRNTDRPRRPTPLDRGSVGQSIKLVRLVSSAASPDNINNVVTVKEYRPRVEDVAGEKITGDDLTDGDDVLLVDTGNEFKAINPRKNILDSRVAYLAYQINGYWVVDNQAVFQTFDGSDFS